jgi:hypothetical protein
MRIFVANAFVLFSDGGVDALAADLGTALEGDGHVVERLRIPFEPAPGAMLAQILALRLTEVSDTGELMICLGAPAHLLRHQRKVLWVGHFGDWATCLGQTRALPRDEQGELLRKAVLTADRISVHEATRVFAASADDRECVRQLSGVVAEPLVPPPGGPPPSQDWTAVVAALSG